MNNKDVAILCFQNICNLTDIEFENESEEDKEMLTRCIEATIAGIRNRQHEATKNGIWDKHEEYNGLDWETLETIKLVDIN